MVKDIFYAVSRKGQGRIFTTMPKREERLGVWVGESVGCISMLVMMMASEGFQMPRLTWDDNPVKLTIELNYV
jgi:hypothetical protein